MSISLAQSRIPVATFLVKIVTSLKKRWTKATGIDEGGGGGGGGVGGGGGGCGEVRSGMSKLTWSVTFKPPTMMVSFIPVQLVAGAGERAGAVKVSIHGTSPRSITTSFVNIRRTKDATKQTTL